MKSLFIKGTNEQYSIREDGQVIIHYKRTKSNTIYYSDIKLVKIDKRNNVYLTLTRRARNTQYSILSLLKEYFNFYYCSCCNKKVFDIKPRIRNCKKCVSENVKRSNAISQIQYINNNREKLNRNDSIRAKKASINLTNGYIGRLFCTTKLPQEIITAKRQQLLLHRQCKTINL